MAAIIVFFDDFSRDKWRQLSFFDRMAAEGYSHHPELGVNKNAYILPRFIAGKISENVIIAAIYRGKNHRKV